MKPKQWITFSLLLIIVGVALLVVNSIVYGPRFVAFSEALRTWAKEPTNTAPLNPASYGLDNTAFFVNYILSFAGDVLIFIGCVYPVVYFIAKVARALGYSKTGEI